MNHDEIITMAKEAGFGMQMALLDHPYCQADAQRLYQQLEHFATMVAAKEREECEALCQRRADVCEAHSEVIRKAQGFTQAWEWVRATARASLRCAAAIRARGTKEGV